MLHKKIIVISSDRYILYIHIEFLKKNLLRKKEIKLTKFYVSLWNKTSYVCVLKFLDSMLILWSNLVWNIHIFFYQSYYINISIFTEKVVQKNKFYK